MTYTPSKFLTFDQFIAEYGDNPRYELIDGELRDMEPTDPHEEVAGTIAGRIYAEIIGNQLSAAKISVGRYNYILPLAQVTT